MEPEEIDRRNLVKTLALGGAAVLPVLPLVPLATAEQRGPHQPKFLSPDDLELVATIGEIILPQTDTPGARAAKVHEHIDLVLSEESAPVQQKFRAGLNWLERHSRELHGRGFLALTPQEQTAILTRIADRKTVRPEDEEANRFFFDVRRRVVFAYYTSEIGLRQELTYKGTQVLEHWEGCPHGGKHGDSDEDL